MGRTVWGVRCGVLGVRCRVISEFRVRVALPFRLVSSISSFCASWTVPSKPLRLGFRVG